MSKESDIDKITPENAEDKISEFLEKAEVGSVKLMAFCDALEQRVFLINLWEQRRLVEIIKGKGDIPKGIKPSPESLDNVESELRIAETHYALVDFANRRNESIIPGYTNALVFLEELILQYEEHLIETEKFGLADPLREELRRRAQAHDYISDSLAGIKTADQSAEGNWLIGLLKSLK